MIYIDMVGIAGVKNSEQCRINAALYHQVERVLYRGRLKKKKKKKANIGIEKSQKHFYTKKQHTKNDVRV